MARVFKDWTFFVLSMLAVLLGMYLLMHADYLDNRLDFFDWIDGPQTAVVLVIVGFATYVSILFTIKPLRNLCLLLHGSLYAMIGTAFLLRDINGAYNLTWIFAYCAFLAVVGVAYKEAGRVQNE